jgi:chemotaxis protein CheX
MDKVKNILIIEESEEKTLLLKHKFAQFHGVQIHTAQNFPEAINLLQENVYFAIVYNAISEIQFTESFVAKTSQLTAPHKTKYLIFLGDLFLDQVAKFNYEFEPRAQVISSQIVVDLLIQKIAQLIKGFNENKKYSVDVKMLNPFVNATTQTLEMMCFTHNLTHLSPKIYDLKNKNIFEVDIAGTLIMESFKFNGRLSICFPKSTFLKLVGNMLSDTYTEINNDIEDAAAELTNMIYGQTKRVLSEQGYDFNKSIPKVVVGDSMFKKLIESYLTIYIPFKCDEGKFYIVITIHD